MNTSHRLILNTAAVYTRSLLSAGLALFSSRWILNAMGAIDFGLFSLVGSVLIFIAFLNTVMATSASRHYAYAIGQGDSDEVNKWFNAALSIHLCFAVSLTFVGWGVGNYLITHVLNIPPERVVVCRQVFQISLVSLFTGMVSIPFVAMFKAKQRIAELSAWDMMQSVLNFSFAWYLTQATGDRLWMYALGVTTILVFIHSILVARAVTNFRECRVVFLQWFDGLKLKEIFTFASWNLIGSLGASFRDQGSAILINLYFGPVANTSYSIARQVSRQTGQLAGAMLGAFSPEISTREGRGERSSMLDLSLRANKFGTLLVLVFVVPLMVEMEYVLKLWLVTPPVYAETFCRYILATFLIDRLTTGYMLAVNAHGKIAGYQATLGTILLLTLPLAWLFLYLGLEPTSVGVAFIVTMTLCSLGRVVWAKYLLGASVYRWIKAVLAPCGMVGGGAALATAFPFISVPSGFLRLILVTGASFIAYLLLTWFFALDKRDRSFFHHNTKKIWSYLIPRRRYN